MAALSVKGWEAARTNGKRQDQTKEVVKKKKRKKKRRRGLGVKEEKGIESVQGRRAGCRWGSILSAGDKMEMSRRL